VVILNGGAVEQVGAPRDVYARPRSAFVADFLGRANFLAGRVSAPGPGPDDVTFMTDRGESLTVRDAGTYAPGAAVQAFIRPERVELWRATEGPGENNLPGKVEQVLFTGSLVTIEVQTLTGRRLVAERPSGGTEAIYEPGDPVQVVLPAAALRLLANTRQGGSDREEAHRRLDSSRSGWGSGTSAV
jgi:ABC-type Fe3+/spermidine/putrescine transport system ATPase subunit